MNAPILDLGPAGVPAGRRREFALQLKTILAPVDFSAASAKGMSFAASLAARFGARLRLVYVVEPTVLPEWGYAHIARREAKLRHDAETRLPQFPLECGLDSALVRVAEVRSGDAADQICKAAIEGQADLVVLASHGLGGIGHALLGSTVAQVIRRTPCPVLTVRERAPGGTRSGGSGDDWKRLLVTTDFSEASKKAFPYTMALARKMGASVLLLHVVAAHLALELSHIGIVLEQRRLLAGARERLPQLRQAELDPSLPVETQVLQGGPAHEICQTALNEGIDLIVMATHGHTGLKHFLLGSVTENVVRHAPCPVLVVREQEREFVREAPPEAEARSHA